MILKKKVVVLDRWSGRGKVRTLAMNVSESEMQSAINEMLNDLGIVVEVEIFQVMDEATGE